MILPLLETGLAVSLRLALSLASLQGRLEHWRQLNLLVVKVVALVSCFLSLGADDAILRAGTPSRVQFLLQSHVHYLRVDSVVAGLVVALIV